MLWLFCSLLVYFSGSQLSNLYRLLLRTCCVNFCIYFNRYFLCSFSSVFRSGVDQSLCASMRSPLMLRLGTLFSLAPRAAEFVSTTLLCTQEVCLRVLSRVRLCFSALVCAVMFVVCEFVVVMFCLDIAFNHNYHILLLKHHQHHFTLPLSYKLFFDVS